MLNGYRTLAATGDLLGVSEDRVRELIERGPLVGREVPGAGLMVHSLDLVAFKRRPLFAVSESGDQSALWQLAAPNPESNSVVRPPLQLATTLALVVADSVGLRRGTKATKAYRALADLPEVARQGERFLGHVVETPSGCHAWTAYTDKPGYGYFKMWPQKVVVAAHRFAWVLANARVIAERRDVDHAGCNNRGCVNPAHLEVVTHAENVRRRDARLTALGTHNMVAARAAQAASRRSRQ